MRRLCKPALLTTAMLTFASTAPPPAVAEEAVNVVASIKPIHSLVASVMAGIGEPTLLVRGGSSPHSYSLRPSDAEALEQAQIVFWVGDSIETFLGDAIVTIASDATSVELGEIDGLVLLPVRESGTWEAHDHDDDGDHHDHEAVDDHGHDDHSAFDTHVWLDPVNAKAMVARIVEDLSAADPEHAALYRENGAETEARLDSLVAEIDGIVAPVRDRPFIVFHDAFHAMENRFGLNGVGSVTVTPDVQPGASRLGEIRDKIAELSAVCVFSEPQFSPALVDTVIEGTDARTAVLDPLGADLADGPDLYFQLMRNNAEALRTCLDPTP